jgi:hypothetical protein
MPSVVKSNQGTWMHIMVVVGVRILEGMFLVGSLGCITVIVLTVIEDVRTLVGHDDDK